MPCCTRRSPLPLEFFLFIIFVYHRPANLNLSTRLSLPYPKMANRELPYESTYVNVVNFLIFDITLISLVYYFTTDVMGRFNDADLSSGERRRLFLTDYPLIGGGLCSTRRFRAALLLLARVVGLSLILATNLTIEGETKRVSKTTTATLVAQGDISNYTREQMLEALFMRSGCQSSRQYQISPSDPENHTVLFYGEIRDQKCEVDQPDLFENAVKFSAKLVRENITVGNCPRREVRNYSDVRTAVFHCDNGIVQCLFLSEIPQRVDLASCRAWYEYKNIQYISGEGNLTSFSIRFYLLLTSIFKIRSCLAFNARRAY